jgi:phytanoyl-CoA hydroxylase
MIMLELHPLNRNFEWVPPSSNPTTITAEQAAKFDRDGYFVLQNCFSGSEIDKVADAIAPFEQMQEERVREAGGQIRISKADAITFTGFLVGQSPVLREFSKHPVFLGLCNDLLGGPAQLYHDQAVYKKPGNPERFPWHQDNGYRFIRPQQYLTCWVALSEASEKHGCPQVAPGLHKQGTLKHWSTPLGWECLHSPENVQVAEARTGDVVVFSSLTPHLTGPNLTNEVRKAYILQYCHVGAREIRAEDDEGILQDLTTQYKVT